MAVIVVEGFDHYSAQADFQARTGALQWNNVYQGFGGFTTGRGGYGQALVVNNPNPYTAIIGGSFWANYGSIYIGTAINVIPTNATYFDVQFMDYVNQVVQLNLRFYTNSGSVVAYAGDPNNSNLPYAQVAASPANVFNPYVWNYFEFGVVPSTSGSFNVQVNGVSVFAASGIRTVGYVISPATTNNWINGIQYNFHNAAGGYSSLAYMDDFYLCDSTTGAGTYPCNTFLGDVAVRAIYATGNSSVTWTPLANANWQEISHAAFPGDSSYNSASSVGNADLFTFGSLPADASVVFYLQAIGAFRKLDAGPQTIVQTIKSGTGTFTSATPHVMSLGYTWLVDGTPVDPNISGSWTPTSVNAVLAGYKLNS